MGTPLTKAATINCDSQGKVDLSKVSSKLQIGGNDVIDTADVGLQKVPIIGCGGHPKGNGPICSFVKSWSSPLKTLQDDDQAVVGLVPPPAIATSDVPAAVLTCTDPGNGTPGNLLLSAD